MLRPTCQQGRGLQTQKQGWGRMEGGLSLQGLGLCLREVEKRWPSNRLVQRDKCPPARPREAQPSGLLENQKRRLGLETQQQVFEM